METLQEARQAMAAGDGGKFCECLQRSLQEKSHLAGEARSQWLALALDALAEGDFQTRWEVTKLLPAFGTDVLPALVRFVREEEADEDLCWFAARALGRFSEPQAIAPLLDLLQSDRGEELQGIAAEALAEVGEAAIAPLARLLAQPDTPPATRKFAVRALAALPHPDAIAPLVSAAREGSSTSRAIALAALASVPDERAVEPLLAAVRDGDGSIRLEAAIGLGLWGLRQRENSGDERAAIAEDTLVDRLGSLVEDSLLEVRLESAIALGRVGSVAAAAVLAETLARPKTPQTLQVQLVRVLSWMELPEAIAILSELLETHASHDEIECHAVLREAARGLGRTSDPSLRAEAAIILRRSLSRLPSGNFAFKQEIATALGRLGDRSALSDLLALLAEPDDRLRLHAIAALKQIDEEEARQQLCLLSSRENLPSDWQRGIALALNEW